MNLPFDPIRTRGRAAKPLEAALVRELDAADIALLSEEKGSKAPALKRISDRHHTLARRLAEGVKPGEAALMCRYDPSRVSILLDDPAFKELVAFYQAGITDKFLGQAEQLAGLSADAMTLLADKLEADLDLPVEDRKVSIGQLMEVTKLGADRTGFGPQSSSTNVNVNVDLAGRLEAARKRVASRTIEGTVE